MNFEVKNNFIHYHKIFNFKNGAIEKDNFESSKKDFENIKKLYAEQIVNKIIHK